MKEKAIVIGPSTTGKSTLVAYFRENTAVPVSESDEELTRMNGGTYPHGFEYRMAHIVPKMIEDILGQERMIFFSNTHYFAPDDLIKARQKKFKVMQLSLARELMVSRSKYRQEHDGYEDHTQYFDSMLAYQQDILERGLVDNVIDTNKPVQEIAAEILQKLEG